VQLRQVAEIPNPTAALHDRQQPAQQPAQPQRPMRRGRAGGTAAREGSEPKLRVGF
jgi:hypothetical protein